MTTPEAMAFDEAEARTTHRWVEYMAMGADNTDFNGTGYFYCDDCGCAEDDAEASERCPESKVGDSRDEGALDWVTLETEDDAAKSLERIERARTDLARIRAAAETRIAEYQARLAHVESFETPRLAEWFARNRPEKKKSINLETGTVGERKRAGGLRVRCAQDLLEWATGCLPSAIVEKVTYSVSKKAVDEHFAKAGEVPPGCELVDDTVTFYVRGPK